MLEHVQQCLHQQLLESPLMPHVVTADVADVLDEALDALGAVHRDDTAAGVLSAVQERKNGISESDLPESGSDPGSSSHRQESGRPERD